MEQWLKGAVVIAGTFIIAILGGWDYPLIALVGFMGADLASALVQVIFRRQFDSSIGSAGIMKKVGFLMAVGGAELFDTYVLSQPLTRTAVAISLTMMDAGSFFARLASWGVPLPEILTNALQREIARKRGEAA
jgi:toxin secretion/phage lysis holin